MSNIVGVRNESIHFSFVLMCTLGFRQLDLQAPNCELECFYHGLFRGRDLSGIQIVLDLGHSIWGYVEVFK